MPWPRSFAICSIIVIILTESPARGFTIPRDNISQAVLPRDLSAEESTLLEVKSDIIRPNDLNSKDNVKADPSDKITEKDENFKGRSPYYPDVSYESSNIGKQIEDKKIFRKLIDKSPRSIELRKQSRFKQEFEQRSSASNEHEDTPGEDAELLKDRVSSVQEDAQNLANSRGEAVTVTIAEEKDKGDKGITENVNSPSISTYPETYNASAGKDILNESKEGQEKNIDTFSPTYPLFTGLLNSTALPDKSLSLNHTQQTNLSNKYTTVSYNESKYKKDKTIEIPEEKSDTSTTVDTSSSFSSVLDSIVELNDILYSTGASKSFDVSQTTQSPPLLTSTSLVSSEMNTDISSSTGPEPTNYTEIKDKPSSTDECNITLTTIASDNEMSNADSRETSITLKKVITATPISVTSQQLSLPSSETETITTPLYTGNTDYIETSSFSTEPDKREMVSSKRAGFLDLTVRTSEKTTKNEVVTTVRAETKETEADGALYEIDLPETETIDHKKASGSESQSQLAEDAIKEELLKEEQLIDHAENEKRYRDEAIGEIDGIRPVAAAPRREYHIVQEPATEDSLSVKPINQDKVKNTSLYTVSANYKPMKKIDVQPPKQFVRDPDDNSWRNESISSLGIVFKPKAPSKSFTQVLRNKTEIEFSNLSGRNKNDVPDLRERLGKIAEVRKSKKKKIDKDGQIVYSDYEESGESSANSSTEPSSIARGPPNSLSTTTATPETPPTTTSAVYKQFNVGPLSTHKPNKFYNIAEYYDSGDEYDAEYAKLSKIDLKKNPKPNNVVVTTPVEFPPQTKLSLPERKPTVQYFPPKVHQKVNINDYDDDFQRKVNFYASKDNPKYGAVPFATVPTVPTPSDKVESADREYTVRPLELTPGYHAGDINKNLYHTGPPRAAEPNDYVAINEGNFNKGSYVIKHFRDFLKEPAKESDDDRNSEYRYTEPPVRGVTITDLTKPKVKPADEDDYEYDSQFRKDILSRFVDNFNQNSERFKVEFPVVYNSSVVHRSGEGGGGVASSSALMKRLYHAAAARINGQLACDACDVSVDLAPAYELHYYVPDQEEKEQVEVEPRPPSAALLPRYRL